MRLQKGCQMQGESFHELGMGTREAIKLRTVGQGGESGAQVDLCVAIEVPLADEPAEAGKDMERVMTSLAQREASGPGLIFEAWEWQKSSAMT